MNGVSYLTQGFRLIAQPQLRRFVIIPLIINILIFSGLISIAGHFFSDLVAWIDGALPEWLAWLNWLLWIVFGVSMLFIMAYLFILIANIIAAPFNGLLSERVQVFLTGKELETKETFAQLAIRSVSRQLSLLLYYVPRALGLLILFLIPVINLVAGPLWFLFNAWMTNLQYLDYPTDNNHISFTKMREHAGKHRWLHFEFGLVTLLLASIPIINLFLMPAAVAGATAMWVKEKPTQ